jgi:hypothetical protein
MFQRSQSGANQYAILFAYEDDQFLSSYLGIPIPYQRLTNSEWKHIEVWLEKRLGSFKRNLLFKMENDSY